MPKRLTVRQAARLIYGKEPSAEQIGKTLRKVKTGEIEGTRIRGYWLTTPDHVAAYLARQSLRQHSHHAAVSSRYPPETQLNAPSRVTSALLKTYHSVLQDYFAAVLFRRRARRTSVRFQRAVTIGQAVCLVLLLLAVFAAVRPLVFSSPPPEHAAIRMWIENNLGECTITKWFPQRAAKDGHGQLIRVQFSYFRSGRKKIDSDLLFLLVDGRVSSVESG